MTNVVEVRHLTKRYGHVLALSDVSLDVGPGVTGLLGPNGAGKSTLLLCVLGLLRGFTGEVRVLGIDARADAREVRRRVGFVPEADAWIADMTAIRAVRHLGRLSGLSRAESLRRAHEVLWHVGLGEAVYREIREYSAGMRQRFKLAQAIVHDPEVLFLDEPLGGLDPQGRDELLLLVTTLAHDHAKHIVWSSHILPEVQKVADQVVVLHQGRSRGTLRLADLERARGRCLVEVDGDRDAFFRRLSAAGIERAAPRDDAPRGTLEHAIVEVVLPPDLQPADVLRLSTETDARVRRLVPSAASLEHAFHELLAPPGPEGRS